jgi:uncharacterized membrane protein (UPF0182 family)
VKIVIDAYSGTMKYYVMDDRDPILKAYSRLFRAFSGSWMT